MKELYVPQKLPTLWINNTFKSRAYIQFIDVLKPPKDKPIEKFDGWEKEKSWKNTGAFSW